MRGSDYAVVIVMGVFFFSALSWIISARKWFHGPVPNISSDDIARANFALEGQRDGETGVVQHDEGQSKSVDESVDKIISESKVE